ncbi:MAG TPA: tetratricopeptide repeat protein [Myxococcales bacterium]|nr:tetratricopeptide repeat protein [Myxococcales bacterium]HIN86648.1 tetratricopeptide repeat protein [Myxococcales bacterium]
MSALHVFLFCALILIPSCSKEHNDSIRLSNQGMKALSSGNIRLAHARFQDAIDIFPDNSSAHYGLGLVLVEFEKLDDAKEHMLIATRLNTELTEADYQLGWIAFKQAKHDDAEAALRRVLERDLEHADAHFLLGRIYENKGKLKEAESALRKAITLNPILTTAYLQLARLYLRVAAEREAVVVLEEGIRINTPNRVRSAMEIALLYNELGFLHLQGGKYGAAVDALLTAIRTDSNRIEVAFNLGCAYASKGEPRMALRYFNQYIGIAPKSDETVSIAREVTRHLYQRVLESESKNSHRKDNDG